MDKLENPSLFKPNDIVVVRFANEYANCQKCQEGIIELEKLQKQNKVGEVIICEVENDHWDTMEKTEDKLRKVAETWTYFSYVLCAFLSTHLKSEKRFRADKKQGIEFLKGYDKTIEGRPISDFE